MRGREEILDALAEADATERAADIAADFVMHILAAAIGVSDWQVCDGTETWDGDVASTVYSVLRAGGVLDKETDETAMARAARVEAERDAARAEAERLRRAWLAVIQAENSCPASGGGCFAKKCGCLAEQEMLLLEHDERAALAAKEGT